MEANHLKRRLTGAVVLVALGVIFIPMLLSVQKEKEIPVFGSNIPPKPVDLQKIEEKTYEQIAPEVIIPPKVDRVVIDESLPEPPPVIPAEKDEPPVTENDGGVSEPEQTTKTDTTTASQAVRAWAVQVGSFSNRSNAMALRDKLIAGKYHAFVDRVDTSKGPTYRVRVGPEVKKEQAEAVRAKLEKEEQLKGLLVRHP